MSRSRQQFLFADAVSSEDKRRSTSSTFVDNMRLPVHRWFRFSAGFSATWVESVVEKALLRGSARVFDPFAGSGTTLLASEVAGAESLGIEAHPFLYRIARAKLCRRADVKTYLALIRRIKQRSSTRSPQTDRYPDLIHKCYSQESLEKLDVLRQALERAQDDSKEYELAWLTLIGILRDCSFAGTAQWQYILPKKRKKRALDPFDAFDGLARVIARDMRISEDLIHGPPARILHRDARTCEDVPDRFATLVVTSPPYPNNYDYADATRLEMCFTGEVAGWADLQSKVRSHLVRSCSQHVPEKSVSLDRVLLSEELDPIRDRITAVCQQLARIRRTKGGKKTYHLMVACYFQDLARVWRSLRRVCDKPSRICFVIGDSAPYGVYVPVIEWMGRLAEAAGFGNYRFEKTRDRNVKWKNRKHRVPLCEGRFWVDG